MVKFPSSFVLGSAVFCAQVALAAPRPRPDSAIGGEVAVSAPNGIPITDTLELSSQLAAESTATQYGSATTSSAVMADVTSMMVYSSSNMVDTSTVMMDSSTMMVDSTSTIMLDSTSTVMYESTSTSSTYLATSSVAYGSGSSNWGSSGYNDCVQQCVASFGAPMATYSPSTVSSDNSGYSGSSVTGVTHTIIVAPTQGVLRYVPFATNASVGDTIKFMWNANVHTVTKSSELDICNKTIDAPFTSGIQNKSFVFTQVVNTTDPTFFYCGVPTHCQKGMFGIINPPSALTASTSVASMMPSLVSNSSDVATMAAYTANMTSGNTVAAGWGGSIDMSSMPAWSYNVVAENVMYSRNFLAANPDVIQADGSVDLGASSSPLMIPQDLSAVLASASSSASSSPASVTSAATSSSAVSASSSATAGAANSSARGLAASTALASAVALAVTLFML